jgi:chemotaxis protein CheX
MTQTESGAKVIQLPEVLDLTFAGPLAESLLAVRGAAVSIDATRVQRAGAQCVQVLLSALSTWRADGVSLSFLEPSTEFRDALSLLGIGLAEITTEEVTP